MAELTPQETEYKKKVEHAYSKVCRLLDPYSNEYNGVISWAKKFEQTRNKVCYMDFIKLRKAHLIMPWHTFYFQKFQELGPYERGEDFVYAFAQLIVEYPDMEAVITEWSNQTKYDKERRKHNAELVKAINNLDADFTNPQSFRKEIIRLSNNRACVNCGSSSVSIFTWDPNNWGKYRTSNRIWFADMRKKPFTSALLDEALQTINERWQEGK
jgi:hypothetical protein